LSSTAITAPAPPAGNSAGSLVLREQAPAFLARLAGRGYAAGTIECYGQLLADLDQHLAFIGIGDLRAVTAEQLEAHQRRLVQRGLASSTRAQSLHVARAFFQWLVDECKLLMSPVQRLRPAPPEKRLPLRMPSMAEARRLFEADEDETLLGIRDRAMVEILYASALRVSELTALQVTDVDLERGLVQVRHGKGDRWRVVPLLESSVAILARYLVAVRPVLVRGRNDEGRLFLRNDGRLLSRQSVGVAVRKLCQRAHVRLYGPHALRHACATHMLARGADIVTVQRLLGHAKLSSTQVYTAVRPGEVKRAHEATHPRERAC
jgi:integrase/recombinase XerD